MQRGAILIVCIISIVINILCMRGQLEIEYVKWGVVGVWMVIFISQILINISHHMKKKLNISIEQERKRSTPKKTLYESISFGALMGWLVTMFLAFMFYYKK